jgi:TrmH family RNA methyltransferase
MAISKSSIKLIKSLQLKKFRKELGLFVVEGEKSIAELVGSNYKIEQIYLSEKIVDHNLKHHCINFVSKEELQQMSQLENNNYGLAVVKIPNIEFVLPDMNQMNLVLDNVQDPGNLGTIVRTAAWYGISHIYCSKDTVDVYNQKVIQSSMGNFVKLNIHYCDLEKDLFQKLPQGFPIWGASLQGINFKTVNIKTGLLVMGNEGKGISANVEKWLTHKIKIESKSNAVESLNVSVATGILLDYFCG